MKKNHLVYKAERSNGTIDVLAEIRLGDPHNNGIQDFAITGRIYDAGKARVDRNLLCCGCCHDDIMELFPEFKIFVNLHLSAFNGIPWGDIRNAYFHLNRNEFDKMQQNLRCTDSEVEQLKKAVDKLHFQYIVESLGIPQRWKQEADNAIKMLEELTGDEFICDSENQRYVPLDNDARLKVESGYYSPERVKERFNEQTAERINEIKEKWAKRKEKRIAMMDAWQEAEILFASMGINNHLLVEGNNSFLVNYDGCKKIVTDEVFQQILDSEDYKRLNSTTGLTFENRKR